jgi:hypothetical protein
MADTAEILALMRHAAARLDEEGKSVGIAFAMLRDRAGTTGAATAAMQDHASYVAASTYAATVLRTVASFMTETEVLDVDPS